MNRVDKNRRLSSSGLKLFRKSLNADDSKKLGLDKALETFLYSREGKEIFDAFETVTRHAGWNRQSPMKPIEALFKPDVKRFISSFSHMSILELISKRFREYASYRDGNGKRIFVTGAGPIGLRMACELALMGCQVTLCEKRSSEDAFNRFNVLHLWEYTADDLLRWGIPRKEIAGDDMHIGTNTVQTTLLRVALMLGVSVRMNTEYLRLVEPKSSKELWKAEIKCCEKNVVDDVPFHVIVGCGGARDRLSLDKNVAGFGDRSRYRSGTNIGIVMMFYRKKASEGPKEFNWSAHFNRELFSNLKNKGLESENVVYYKDPHVHYLVFTPTVRALGKYGVLNSTKRDENERLLYSGNVNKEKLMDFSMQAAKIFDLPWKNGLTAAPGIFDFSERTKGREAGVLLQKSGSEALAFIAGDALMEPFWPEGLGMNRGFLTALDTAWVLQKYIRGKCNAKETIEEREDLYYVMRDLAAKTRSQVLTKMIIHGEGWTIDPSTRYNRSVYPPSRETILARKAEAKARTELRMKRRKQSKEEDPREKGGIVVSRRCESALNKMKLRRSNRFLVFEIDSESRLQVAKVGLKRDKAENLVKNLPRRGCRYAVWNTADPTDRHSRGDNLLIAWNPVGACGEERDKYRKCLVYAKKLCCGMRVLKAKRKDDLQKELEPEMSNDCDDDDDWLDDM
eukprot:g2474.t1